MGRRTAERVYLEFVESYENIDGSDPTIDREKVAQYYTWTLDELWGKKDPRFKMPRSIRKARHGRTREPP